MKRKLKWIWLCIGTFVLAFSLAFLYLASFLGIFSRFGVMSDKTAVLIALCGALAFALFFLVYQIVWINATRKSKFSNWLSSNSSRLLLYYVISTIIFASIKPTLLWSFEEIKDVVSLQWTIFGLSITIFLVWDVLILRYLKDKKPQKGKEMALLQKREYFQEKSNFYQNASIMFNSIVLLTMNLLVLVLSTVTVYMTGSAVSLLAQNLVTVSFYLCTNTIIALLMDIIQLLNEEKRAMLKDTRVTSEEIDLQNSIQAQIDATLASLKTIDQLQSLNDEQKTATKSELLYKLLGTKLLSEQKSGSNEDGAGDRP